DTAPSYNYYFNGTLNVVNTVHPITQGLTNFFLNSYVEFSPNGADPGATVLATVNGQASVVACTPGQGRSVYLGPIYMDGASAYTPGQADRLFEQAVAWAGGVDRVDTYSFVAHEGDNLLLTTATPGGGPGEPVNNLDPQIELSNPLGFIVASDDNGAA